MRIIFLIILCLNIFCNVIAQSDLSSFQALDLPTSARQAILNQPISIHDNDIEVGVLNPAMLNKKMHNQFSLNFVDYFSDINFVSAAYSFPFRNFSSLIVSVKSFDYGEFIETNYSSEILGSFNVNEQIISIGLSKELSKKWAIGTSLKTLFSNFQNYKSIVVASDVGIVYKEEEKNLFFSLLARNIGQQISSYASTKELLPLQCDFSMSKRLDHLPFLIVINYKDIQKWDLTPISQFSLSGSNLSDNNSNNQINFTNKLFRHIDFGGELNIGKRICLRIGYNPKRRQELKVNSYLGMVGFSWGLGIKISHFTINYGRSSYHLHGSPNYFSFSTSFSKFYK